MASNRKVRVNRAYVAQYPNPIEVASGAKVRVGREDNEFPGWRWCTAPDGREGWVPVALLSITGTEATVLQNYSARELTVAAGEEVEVEETRHDWLRVRNAEGQRGWIPANTVY